jgi:predicted cobalt transporter CbtA
MSKQSFGLDPKQFALLMQTDWKNFKPATPKKPKPTTPAPATATPAPAPEKEEEAAAEDDEGMSTTAMLAIGAAVLAGGFFLLRRK